MDTAGSVNAASGGGALWGCAIPITRAMSIAQQIRAGTASPYIESGHRGILGVSLDSKASVSGAAVDGVTDGDGAADAGIGPGDVITSVAAIPVQSVSDLNSVMQDRRPGDRLTVVWRDAFGTMHSATVTLSAGPPA